jgi:hypothetical protein
MVTERRSLLDGVCKDRMFGIVSTEFEQILEHTDDHVQSDIMHICHIHVKMIISPARSWTEPSLSPVSLPPGTGLRWPRSAKFEYVFEPAPGDLRGGCLT